MDTARQVPSGDNLGEEERKHGCTETRHQAELLGSDRLDIQRVSGTRHQQDELSRVTVIGHESKSVSRHIRFGSRLLQTCNKDQTPLC